MVSKLSPLKHEPSTHRGAGDDATDEPEDAPRKLQAPINKFSKPMLSETMSAFTNQDKHLRGACESVLSAVYRAHPDVMLDNWKADRQGCIPALKDLVRTLHPRIVRVAQGEMDLQRFRF